MKSEEQMRAAFEAWNTKTGRTTIDHELLDTWETAWQAATAAAQSGAPEEWDGAEEWMPLAWALCAEENGEDACNELLWSGGPIPEPWGDRWLTYEDEAKRMIALVRKHLAAAPSPPAAERVDVERVRAVIALIRSYACSPDEPESYWADELTAAIGDKA